MGEIVRFVPKSELERARLIAEARAIYDSIFPPAAPNRAPRDGEESVKSGLRAARRYVGLCFRLG